MSTTLFPTWTLGDLELSSYPFGVEFDGDHGAPETISQLVTSMIADGDLVRQTRHGNREVSIVVTVEGPSLGVLAENEAILRAECLKPRNLLTFNPGDIDSPASVFEVLMVSMTQPRSDMHESHLVRRWELTITCLPFARSAEMVTVEAIESGATTVTIDDCTSVTGWTGTRNGAPSPGDGPTTFWEAGAVGIMELDSVNGFAPEAWVLTRTGAVDFSATRFLEVEVTTLDAKGGASLNVTAHLNGASTALPVVQIRRLADDSGYFRVTYDTLGVAASSITFKHTSVSGYGFLWQGMSVRNLNRTNVAPGVTARQLTRIIETGGTERTPASIHVADPGDSAPLGLTIVHTSPEDGSGYSPPLRRWRVSGNTIDSPRPGTMSGALEAINPGGVVFRVPTQALPMSGYLLVARLATTATSTVPIFWSAGTIVSEGGAQQEVTVNRTVWNFTDTEWNLVPLGIVTLPTLRTQTGWVEIGIQRDPTSPMHVIYDDAWLFREGDDCALTMNDAPWSNLWLESPDVSNPVPTVYMGPSRDVRWHPGAHLKAMGTHVLSPEGTSVFTATDGVDHPRTSATFYRRWHSNAAE